MSREAWTQIEPNGTGWLFPGPSPLNGRYDRREDFDTADTVDCGPIGEDAEGIWVKQDPFFLSLEHPEVWPAVWAATVAGEVRREDAASMHCFDFMLMCHALAAIHRARFKPRPEGEG